MRWRWFVVTAPGLEQVTGAEIAALGGASELRVVPGGVELEGPPEVAYRANLWLRTATRVLARVGEVAARDFGKLRRQAAALPWETVVAPGGPVKIAASTHRCRLYHTGAIAETIELAISDRLGSLAARPAPGASPCLVLVRGEDDRFTLSVDASGERLHRRGWRLETARAPLRESLAAGLLALCEWDPSLALCDPMCGAGTIPLEACAAALKVAPGLRRGFAFERWPIFAASGATAWAQIKAEAAEKMRPAPPAPILASDKSPGAVEAARANAERAGFALHVRIEQRELGDVQPPAESGVVIINPPYGRRLGTTHLAKRLYTEVGRVLRARFGGWRVGLLVANRTLAQGVGLPLVASHRLHNGGIPVVLLRFEVPR
jgi:putative N6-adenine-specific DNA methylase